MGEHHLARLAEHSLERVGDRPALLFEGTWHRSGELATRAARTARGLRERGVEPGDRVVVLMANGPEVGITYTASWRAGAVVTPVVFLVTPEELRHILVDSEAKIMVTSPELIATAAAARGDLDVLIVVAGPVPADAENMITFDELEAAEPGAIVDRDDLDLAALLYTGGTTGRAKGVMLTHEGLWRTGASSWQLSSQMEVERTLVPLPLSHAYGLIVTLVGMHSDRTGYAILQRWFDPKGFCELVQEHRVQQTSVVPSMLQMLLALPLEDYDLTSLTYVTSGGAALPAAVREQFGRRVPSAEILEGYGCTESSAVISTSRPGMSKSGTVGKPLPGVTVTIRDDSGGVLPPGTDGEICAGGPGVMKGYWKSPEATEATLTDGVLHTGDIGHLDEEGFLVIVDRKKDLVIRGGFNIYPRDVEDVLLTHPEITGAAVVGRPDERLGEEVVAFVSVVPGSVLTPEAVIAHAKLHLAHHKYPREVRIVERVPLTAVGKTDRKAARALLARN